MVIKYYRYKNREWLFDQYIKLKKSTTEIGKICNVNSSTILYWLKKFKIKIRSMSEANKIAMNKPEIKEKLSISQKIRFSDPKERKKESESHKGLKQSKKSKRKISESLKGKKKSEDHKRKISESLKGRNLTEEHKKNLSESHKGLKQSEESKRKNSESHKGNKNPNWKGDNAKYDAIHTWIRKNKPKPKYCEDCKRSENYDIENGYGKLELSNITGKLIRDINNFKWVHRSCHTIYDKKNNIIHEGL